MTSKQIIIPLPPTLNTMRSVQLHEIIFNETGKYAKLGDFHRHLKKVLVNQLNVILASSELLPNGYVKHYNLTEVQANMVMASIDYKHLELIAKVFVLTKNNQNALVPDLPKSLPDALRAFADEVEAHEETQLALEHESQAHLETKIQLSENMEWATIKYVDKKFGIKASWHILKSWSTALEINRKDVFDANYGTVKSYHADVWMAAYSIEIH